jgi:hypothetical protein
MLEVEANPRDDEEVKQILSDFGLDGTVRPSLFRMSEGDLPWVVIIEFGVPVSAFFTALATAAGTEAWRALRDFVGRIATARRESMKREGNITISGIRHGKLNIDDSLPDEAFVQLLEEQLDEVEEGYLVWDPDVGHWRDYRRR